MQHRWIARCAVLALHLGLGAALWSHQAPSPEPAGERRATPVRLLPDTPPPRTPSQPRTDTQPAPAALAPLPLQQLPEPPAWQLGDAGAPAAATAPLPALPGPAHPNEAPRPSLRLTLPPGYAASSAAARNPALSDPRSNTPPRTLESRIADATGGEWTEERTSDNRALVVGALGDRRTVMRRGDTCVEVFRSRIADQDPFNANVAPRTAGMLGKPYKCR